MRLRHKLVMLRYRYTPTASLIASIREGGKRGANQALIEALRERLAHQDGSLEGVDLSGAWLDGALLSAARMAGASFRHARLRGAYFGYCDLTATDFAGADLRGASFREAQLIGADFRGADLRDVNFARANLRDAKLAEADLRGANFWGAALPELAELRAVEPEHVLEMPARTVIPASDSRLAAED